MNVSRFLREQSSAFAAAPTADAEGAPPVEGLPLRLVSTTMPPVNPRNAPENVLDEGDFVFAPQREMVIDLALTAAAPVRVGRFRMTAPAESPYSLPKSILLRYSFDGGTRFRDWDRLEMGPDGFLDTGRMPPRNMTHIRVHVFDAWTPGPIAISLIIAEEG